MSSPASSLCSPSKQERITPPTVVVDEETSNTSNSHSHSYSNSTPHHHHLQTVHNNHPQNHLHNNHNNNVHLIHQPNDLSKLLNHQHTTNHDHMHNTNTQSSEHHNENKISYRGVFASSGPGGSPNSGSMSIVGTHISSHLTIMPSQMSPPSSASLNWTLPSPDKSLFQQPMFSLFSSQNPSQSHFSSSNSGVHHSHHHYVDERSHQVELLGLNMDPSSILLKQPANYGSCVVPTSLSSLEIQQQEMHQYSRNESLSVPKYQWLDSPVEYGSPQQSQQQFVQEQSASSASSSSVLIPKQEPYSTPTSCQPNDSGHLQSQSNSQATYAVQLAEYNQATSKGHEILSQVYQQSPMPLKLVPVKPRKYPNRPSKTPVHERPCKLNNKAIMGVLGNTLQKRN